MHSAFRVFSEIKAGEFTERM